jgi:sRNA-binding protein
MIKKYKKEIKDKQKEQAKKAKDEEKQKAKKAKEDAKDKAKEEKQKAKKSIKTKPSIETENVVIGETNIIDLTINTGCIEILKSGQNKGKQCGCKIILDDLCNRHFKIKNGIIVNNI